MWRYSLLGLVVACITVCALLVCSLPAHDSKIWWPMGRVELAVDIVHVLPVFVGVSAMGAMGSLHLWTYNLVKTLAGNLHVDDYGAGFIIYR
jgi:hypothetical protein